MQSMLDSVNEWLKELLIEGIILNLSGMFDQVNKKVGEIAVDIGMTYELIQMVIDRNNLHEIDTWIFFKWIFKTFIAVMLVTNTFKIVMGIFEVVPKSCNL